MTFSYQIELAEGAFELGLPDMLKDLIGQNLEAHPGKIADFNKLAVRIGLTVVDADAAVTLDFNKGRLVIHAGLQKPVQITVTADAESIMALSNQTIKWGLPYYFDDTGKEIMAAMKSGRLKAQGMFLHMPSMIRFSRVMSVR
jgi:hypothetical protein